MTNYRIAASLLALLFVTSVAIADDWPQWLGPGGASEWSETGIRTTLPEGDLPVKWRADCSYGYAGPAVAGGKVYLFDYEVTSGKVENNPGRPIKLAGRERLHCLDAATGQVAWTKGSNVEYYVSYPGGPRATPTVDGDHVYTLGTEGDLTCRRTADGEQVWHVSFKEKFGAKTPVGGHSSC
ncbi:MAG: PQQ-binding-like beta-propeller repeat protein, partial [Aeoliella sp.]